MQEKIQKLIKKERNKNYLAKDFDSFRSELLRYAKSYFPDKIQDFSESSLGGLFLDMNAIVGDNLSYYLDHQFRELDPNTAIEPVNIENHLRNAGVKIQGASPSVVELTIYVETFGVKNAIENIVPDRSLLPKIKAGSVFKSNNGINFTLVQDIDFTEQNSSGDLIASVVVGSSPNNSSNGTFLLSKTGICISGEEKTDNFIISNNFVPFRTLTLSSPNVTEIIYIIDSDGNKYYEVDYLTQSNIFSEISNYNSSNDSVENFSSLELIPVPYRFTTETKLSSRITTVRFGSGNANSLDDDIIPDPSDVSLPLYGKNYFPKISIDPNKLLETQSLGISPTNTTITINYRYGGGTNHNVSPNSIKTIKILEREFPKANEFSSNNYPFIQNNDFNSLSQKVINSLDVNNVSNSIGGSAAPTIEELKSQINSSRFLQSRIVSKPDLLARIYSLPAKFGRVYRAAVSDSLEKNGAPVIHIISLDSNKNLTLCSDTLKKNLSIYLNEFRLMSESYEILDASIINFKIKYKILTNPNLNKFTLIKNINTKLADFIRILNFQINQPIIEDEIRTVILKELGVISIVELLIENIEVDSNNQFSGRNYSNFRYNFENYKKNGVYIPTNGSVFELKYPNVDILGAAI